MNRVQSPANFMAAQPRVRCKSLYFVADLPVELAAFMARSEVFNAANKLKAVITTRLRGGANRVGS